MAQKTIVALHPDVLKNHLIDSALSWIKYFSKYRAADEPPVPDEELRKRMTAIGCIVIVASKYDPDHQFGPVLTVEGDGSNLELVVPWRHVLAVVIDKTGKLEIGFRETTPHPKADQ